MPTETFSHVYLLNPNTFVVEAALPGSLTIDTGSDTILTAGETFNYSGNVAGSSGTFSYASGGGFVFHSFGGDYWVTDTPHNPGDTATDDGANFVVCFLAGTMLATPGGLRAIETLGAGDLVLTADGAAQPVLWLARQTVSTRFADPVRVLPIRIAAGALGEALPARDLFVSPDHALLVAGVLVQAGALVNGTSIARIAAPGASFVYYHIELDDHALVLAEGMPAETFVDNVTRRRFDNYAEYEARFGPERPTIAELDLPRIKSPRQLPPAIRSLVAERSAAIGLAAGRAA